MEIDRGGGGLEVRRVRVGPLKSPICCVPQRPGVALLQHLPGETGRGVSYAIILHRRQKQPLNQCDKKTEVLELELGVGIIHISKTAC